MSYPHPLNWNWHEAGFLFPPIPVTTSGVTTVYRVWGGISLEEGDGRKPGVCMSFQAPSTRREAESLFAILEYGNAARFVTTFLVAPGATIFVGMVHPGDLFQSGLGPPGSQVFIETPVMQRFVLKVGQHRVLTNDLVGYSVVPRGDRGKPFDS